MTIQGAKSKQEEATERACRSPTLLNEVNASKRATLRVIIFSDTELNGHKGSNGASSSAPRTIQRCQEGICGQQIGLSHLAPQKNRYTKGCLPTEAPSKGSWLVEIVDTKTFRVAGAS